MSTFSNTTSRTVRRVGGATEWAGGLMCASDRGRHPCRAVASSVGPRGWAAFRQRVDMQVVERSARFRAVKTAVQDRCRGAAR